MRDAARDAQVRRARALLDRCDAIQKRYGDQLNAGGWALLTHAAFSAVLDLREAGETIATATGETPR